MYEELGMMGGNNAEIGVPEVEGVGVDGPASSGEGMLGVREESSCCGWSSWEW